MKLPHHQTNKRSSTAMSSITQNKRYLPHEITTKENSVKLYRQTKDIGFVCRRYHISKASLMRWNKKYNGSRESLAPKSHRPHTQHPNAHTEQELSWIRNLHRRNPNISVCEMYGKLRQEKAYSRHPGTGYLFGWGTARRWNLQRKKPSTTVTMTRQRNWGSNGRWM